MGCQTSESLWFLKSKALWCYSFSFDLHLISNNKSFFWDRIGLIIKIKKIKNIEMSLSWFLLLIAVYGGRTNKRGDLWFDL